MKKLFSLIALVGIIAACTPEQIKTAFTLAGGSVIVDVEVVDIINGGAYTGDVTVSTTFPGATVNGKTITFQADESKTIPEGNYTVTVTGPALAKAYTAAYMVPEVLAAGQARIKVVVPVGEPINGYTPDVDFVEVDPEPRVAFLVNDDYPTHAYSHGGVDTWYYNNTEFAIPGTVEYASGQAFVVTDVEDYNVLGFEGYAELLAESFQEEYTDIDVYPYDFMVSAWAMWNITQTAYGTEGVALVSFFKDANGNEEYDEGEEVYPAGSFDYVRVFADVLEYHELPYPGAPGHAHYAPGHGQDAHGSMPNAGGGMSENE